MIIVTYKLVSPPVPGFPTWNARIYKGEKLLPVDFFGDSEDEVRRKASKYIFDANMPKLLAVEPTEGDRQFSAMLIAQPIAHLNSQGVVAVSGRGQGFVGKVWMLNRETGHKCRVEPGSVEGMIQAGYCKAGPRSK